MFDALSLAKDLTGLIFEAKALGLQLDIEGSFVDPLPCPIRGFTPEALRVIAVSMNVYHSRLRITVLLVNDIPNGTKIASPSNRAAAWQPCSTA